MVFLHLYTRDIWKYRLLEIVALTRAKVIDFNNSDIHVTVITLKYDMVWHSLCCPHLTWAHAHPSQHRLTIALNPNQSSTTTWDSHRSRDNLLDIFCTTVVENTVCCMYSICNILSTHFLLWILRKEQKIWLNWGMYLILSCNFLIALLLLF